MITVCRSSHRHVELVDVVLREVAELEIPVRRPRPVRRREAVHQQLQQRRLASTVLANDADPGPNQLF